MNNNCFNFFKERFQINNWSQLKNKLINLSRPSNSSRTSLKRRMQNEAYRSKKKDMKTITQYLNDFKKSTALCNYRLCIICEQFLLEFSAVEILNTDSLYEELNLDSMPEKKRLNKFWICLLCQNTKQKKDIRLSNPIMKLFEFEGHKILYPTDINDDQGEAIEISRNMLIMIPKTNHRWSRNKGENIPIDLYKNYELSNELISSFYNIRLAKFVQRQAYAELFDAEIAVNTIKTLSSVRKITDESKIRGSSSWVGKRRNTILSQFTQYGQAAIAFSVDIPMDNLESIVTSKLCNGEILTLDFQGNLDDEHLTKYNLHRHDHSTACSDTCDTTEITGVNEFLEDKYMPVFISSISQKQAGLVEKFIKGKNFDFYGEDYFCGIDFYQNGNARINGMIWTFECNILNEEISSNSFSGNNSEMEDYLLYLDNSILTTTDNMCIKDFLGVNEEESLKVHNLSKRFQVDMNMKEEFIPLPSYMTMFRMKPKTESIGNLISSKRILRVFKASLIKLTEEEKMFLSTEDWLETLNKKTTFDLTDESKIYIIFEEELYTFIVDQKLNDLIKNFNYFVAIYHYALSCSNKEFSIVLRRLKILDCFTYPYNATLLKAFCAKIEILPIFSIHGWWNFDRKYEEMMPDLENTELAPLLTTHYLVSLPELFSLTEATRIRDLSSAGIEYVSTHISHKPKFRRVKIRNEDTFECPGVGFFEQCASNVIRHFKRMNAEHLLLVETSLYYDVLQKKDAKDIFDLYTEKLNQIPNGDITGVYGKPLPTYILCSNKQVLKLRRKMKILQIPQFHTLSKENKFSRISLFYPLKPGTCIDMDRLG